MTSVLVMSVEPGFGGQKFMPEVLEKVRSLKPKLRLETLLSIDGGIASPTIASAAAAGCQIFVAGSAIFDGPDYQTAIRNLERLANCEIVVIHRTGSVRCVFPSTAGTDFSVIQSTLFRTLILFGVSGVRIRRYRAGDVC